MAEHGPCAGGSHRVALNRIGTISYGADAPAAPNDNRTGRQANRRVVLIVLT